MSAISLASNFLPPILGSALQGIARAAGKTANKIGGINLPAGPRPDSGGVSPFAQILVSLQQLQQSDSAKYKDVTQQISTNLQNASQTAQSNGDTGAAALLSRISNDFADASKSGQLPNAQDLASALKGHHPHHRYHRAEAAAGAQTGDQSLKALLDAFKTNFAASDAANPLSIIQNSLSEAGVKSGGG